MFKHPIQWIIMLFCFWWSFSIFLALIPAIWYPHNRDDNWNIFCIWKLLSNIKMIFRSWLPEYEYRSTLKIVNSFQIILMWKTLIEMFYLNSTLNFGIPPVLVFQLEVYYMVDRLLAGLTAQQEGTTGRWYSNLYPLLHYLLSMYPFISEMLLC